MAQIRPRFPDFVRFSTSNLASLYLRPQRELEAHIRWLCSPGALFKIVGTDFYFFDFFAENFSIFENPTSENPEISVTIGFPIVILGRKSSKNATSDFSESRTTPDPTVGVTGTSTRVQCFFFHVWTWNIFYFHVGEILQKLWTWIFFLDMEENFEILMRFPKIPRRSCECIRKV